MSALMSESSISCGVRELFELSNGPKECVRTVAHDLINLEGTYTFVLFSDNDANGHGIKLAKFIKQNKLGRLVATTPRHNRNHPGGPKIRVWTWTPAITKLGKFKPKKLQEETNSWGDSVSEWEDGFDEDSHISGNW